MKTVKFGLIGLGLMGKEFASAAMRWSHLPGIDVKPEIIALCSKTMPAGREAWYREGLGTVKQVTTDYHELLSNPEVEAVYCAVPHNLHEQMYIDIIKAGKHLMAEKPFGIDLKANEAILKTVHEHPEVFVRCCSQYYFAPGMQRICQMIENDAFGRIIEVDVELLHSSDLNPDKPINWKRMVEFNGEYGVMGDLAMHICFVPFRAGWLPRDVRAVLSNLMPERPDGTGAKVACETWDNAT
ncbi:MAG: Gfo/Idh/MocA family oxidoreductase, partial [Spirochaetales bacterium]|nr:Gfo/Idh/MocA family oxidoreductase [Spirochaetales bacterium]